MPAKNNTTARAPVHRRQQRSKTLMRQAVKRPGPSIKRQIKVFGPAERAQAITIISQPTNNELKLERYRMRKRIKRSSQISHFGPSLNPPVNMEINQPLVNQPEPVAPTLTLPEKPSSALSTDELFERAIRLASSHEAPKRKPTKLKRLLRRH